MKISAQLQSVAANGITLPQLSRRVGYALYLHLCDLPTARQVTHACLISCVAKVLK